MPSHDIHDIFAKLLLGKSSYKTDKLMDLGVEIFGKEHRKIWGHDPLSIAMICLLGGRIDEALLHLLIDYTFTDLKNIGNNNVKNNSNLLNEILKTLGKK